MIVVDSSVWIDYFNGRPTSEADALSRAMEELTAQQETRGEERRLGESEAATLGASLKQMEAEAQRI